MAVAFVICRRWDGILNVENPPQKQFVLAFPHKNRSALTAKEALELVSKPVEPERIRCYKVCGVTTLVYTDDESMATESNLPADL